MSPATAEAKANACKLPVPTYRIGTSQKAKRCINIQDLAEYIDKRREEGRIEWGTGQNKQTEGQRTSLKKNPPKGGFSKAPAMIMLLCDDEAYPAALYQRQ